MAAKSERIIGSMKHIFLVSFVGIILLFIYTLALGQGKSWETYIQTGDSAITQKRYADAEQAYREALKLSEKFRDNDARIAVNLIKLAESLNLQAKNEEAEAFATRSITALEKASKSPKSKDLAEEYYKSDTSAMILDKAADILVANRKYFEAEPIYKRIIVIREEAANVKESPKNNEDFLKLLGQAMTNAQAKVADATDKLANLYLVMRRFEDAEPLYIKSLKIREAQYGTDKPPVGISLNSLGTLYAIQAKYEKAEPLYVRAIGIFEQTKWLDDPAVATTYENYSLLLKKTGREAEAIVPLNKAKAIRAKLQQNKR
jgi:tetratricopeptide (TPR) repeat protein